MKKNIISSQKDRRFLRTPMPPPQKDRRFLGTAIFLLLLLLAAVFFLLREPPKEAMAPDTAPSVSMPSISIYKYPNPSSSPGIDFEIVDPLHKRAKYIFLMIGDGMGEAQRSLAQSYAAYRGEKTPLIMNSLPVSGRVTTSALNSAVTDSAAAATAFATGYKTDKGMLSVTPDGKALKTIMEEAEERGLSTGLVTTTTITNATPAAFASHERSRTYEANIALDYLNSGVDFFAGGGARSFLPSSYSGGLDAAGVSLKSSRNDTKDLVSDFKDLGYKTFIGQQGAEEFETYSPSAGDKVFASFTNDHLPYELDRTEGRLAVPSLAEMTDKAISALEYDKDGFVLMVEGGRIDHACNANDAAGAVNEALGFNKAVEEAYAFYSKHPGETLIIVVADHETGGLKLGSDLDLSHIPDVKLSVAERLYAYTGEGKAFYDYVSQNFGLNDLNQSEKTVIENAFNFIDSKYYKGGYSGTPAYVVSVIISKRTGITWSGTEHTGTPVLLYAVGPGAEDFSGNIDNADVGKLLFDMIDS